MYNFWFISANACLISHLWKCSRTIAIHLFDRLGDEELTNRVEASALFSKLGMATPVVL